MVGLVVEEDHNAIDLYQSYLTDALTALIHLLNTFACSLEPSPRVLSFCLPRVWHLLLDQLSSILLFD